MINAIRSAVAALARWNAKRKHDREWPVEYQLERLRSTIAEDHQWLCHSAIANALCTRYRALLQPDWEKQPVERISSLRSRLSLDPLVNRPTTTAAVDRNAVLEQAARACEKIAEQRFAEHGIREWDTGATYYSGRAAEQYEAQDEENAECVAAIRALKNDRPTAVSADAQKGGVR